MRQATRAHPQLEEAVKPSLERTATIQRDQSDQDSGPQVVEDWQDLAGHIDIPCSRGAVSTITNAEGRSAALTLEAKSYRVLLYGWLSTVTVKDRIVFDDGIVCGILGVERPAGGADLTYILCERRTTD